MYIFGKIMFSGCVAILNSIFTIATYTRVYFVFVQRAFCKISVETKKKIIHLITKYCMFLNYLYKNFSENTMCSTAISRWVGAYYKRRCLSARNAWCLSHHWGLFLLEFSFRLAVLFLCNTNFYLFTMVRMRISVLVFQKQEDLRRKRFFFRVEIRKPRVI